MDLWTECVAAFLVVIIVVGAYHRQAGMFSGVLDFLIFIFFIACTVILQLLELHRSNFTFTWVLVSHRTLLKTRTKLEFQGCPAIKCFFVVGFSSSCFYFCCYHCCRYRCCRCCWAMNKAAGKQDKVRLVEWLVRAVVSTHLCCQTRDRPSDSPVSSCRSRHFTPPPYHLAPNEWIIHQWALTLWQWLLLGNVVWYVNITLINASYRIISNYKCSARPLNFQYKSRSGIKKKCGLPYLSSVLVWNTSPFLWYLEWPVCPDRGWTTTPKAAPDKRRQGCTKARIQAGRLAGWGSDHWRCGVDV